MPRCQGRYQFESAASRLGGAVEEREHAVAGVLGAVTAVPRQQAVNQSVVRVKLMAPMRVTVNAEQLGGADDVAEEHVPSLVELG